MNQQVKQNLRGTLISAPHSIPWGSWPRGWKTHRRGSSLVWLISRCWLSSGSSMGTVGQQLYFLPKGCLGILMAWWLCFKSKSSKRWEVKLPFSKSWAPKLALCLFNWFYLSSTHRAQSQGEGTLTSQLEECQIIFWRHVLHITNGLKHQDQS